MCVSHLKSATSRSRPKSLSLGSSGITRPLQVDSKSLGLRIARLLSVELSGLNRPPMLSYRCFRSGLNGFCRWSAVQRRRQAVGILCRSVSRLDCAGRASSRPILSHILRHQITVMMSSGAHVIIEPLHFPNAYGALGRYIRDGGGDVVLQSSLLPSPVAPITFIYWYQTNMTDQDSR